jgi:hypothetical protein
VCVGSERFLVLFCSGFFFLWKGSSGVVEFVSTVVIAIDGTKSYPLY